MHDKLNQHHITPTDMRHHSIHAWIVHVHQIAHLIVSKSMHQIAYGLPNTIEQRREENGRLGLDRRAPARVHACLGLGRPPMPVHASCAGPCARTHAVRTSVCMPGPPETKRILFFLFFFLFRPGFFQILFRPSWLLEA